MNVDPLVDKYPSLTPYVYCANNPLVYIDPNGKDITSVKEEYEEGNVIYKITYTATVINESDVVYTNEELEKFASIISNQIEQSFTGSTKDGKIKWEAKADIVVGTKAREGDNIIRILPSKSGESGRAQVPSDIQNISVETLIYGSDFQISRTGAHEFGHGAGLYHPVDSKTGNLITFNIRNLMQQSRYSMGTNITFDQIRELHKMVNFWFGARKK